MKTCPFCAEAIQDKAIVCKHCGRDLTPSAPPQPKKKPASFAATLLIIVGSVFGVIVLLVIVGEVSGGRSPDLTLLTLSEDRRADLLQKVIAGTGGACQRVNRTFHQGRDASGSVVWNVDCGPRQYMVSIENDGKGSARVLDCAVLRAVSKVDCFVRFDRQ